MRRGNLSSGLLPPRYTRYRNDGESDIKRSRNKCGIKKFLENKNFFTFAKHNYQVHLQVDYSHF